MTTASTLFYLYPFIKDFSVLFLIIAIPIIYATGHIIHTIDYFLLRFHVFLYKLVRNHTFLKGKKIPEIILKVSKLLFYNHRVVNSIFKFMRLKKVKDTETFWDKWYQIRVSEKYVHAEYWHRQNDLFKGLYLIFISSTIFCLTNGQWGLMLIFLFFTIIFYLRAIQYADNFVEVVILTSKNLEENKLG